MLALHKPAYASLAKRMPYLLLMLFFLLASSISHAQESINVRGQNYPGFGRLVIEWGAPFDYGINYDGTRLNLVFSRAFRGSFNGAVGNIRTYISDVRVSDERTSIVLFAASPFKINSFTTSNTLVIDFLPLEEGEIAQRQVAGRLNVTDWLEQTGELQDNQIITEIQIDDPDVIFTKGIDPETYNPEVAVLPLRKDPEEEQEKTIQQELAFDPIDPTELPPVLGGHFFPFEQPTGAAVFRRGRFLWVLFDTYLEVDPLDVIERTRNAVVSLEQQPIADATVLRMTTKTGLNPILRRGPNGTGWIMDFYEREFGPLESVDIDYELSNVVLGPQIVFPSINTGRLIYLEDPEIGNTIRVITYLEPGVGVPWQRYLPEMNILKTAQGVALEFFKNSTAVTAHPDAFIVSDRTGLHLSALKPEQIIDRSPVGSSEQASAQFGSKKIFRFIEWRGNPQKEFYEKYVDYLYEISLRDIEERIAIRYDFAKFLLANGFAHDALGLLQVIEEQNPTSADTQEFIAIRGAANMMANRLNAAELDIFDQRLDDFQEIYAWRAVWYAKNAQWGKAETNFRLAENIYRLYPSPLLAFVGLPRLDTSLALRDIDFAKTLFPVIDNGSSPLSQNQINSLKYQEGRIAIGDGNNDKAEQLWTEVATQLDDPYNGARAEYALLSLQYRNNKLSPAEISERLDRLRYRWRGDRFELNVLNQIAEIELAEGNYREALVVLRQAVSSFGNDPLAAKLTRRMEDIFSLLFRDNLADRMPPLRALSLFDEFRELTPPNRSGNLMIENLVDRLINVDLLEEAAELLSYQIDYRLDGLERARVGLKLAIVRLIDNRPEDAIVALNSTTYPTLPASLQDDRRRVRAKAHYEMDEIQEATLLIAGDLSLDADLIRQDIYWEQSNWLEVAKVMQRLAGPPLEAGETLNNTRARTILYWTVALLLDDNMIDLASLRETFEEAMLESEYASIYSFILSTGAEDNKNIRDLVDNLADADRFTDFIDTYRSRLRQKTA